MEIVEVAVVGAGAVGLAVAWELSKEHKDILVLEKNRAFGQETSSRNSEVIHAGIYYPRNSLKAVACIEGRGLLYSFCALNNIAHKRIGKLIVAIEAQEERDLEALFENGRQNGATELALFSERDAARLEPHVKARAAIWSPGTGILDTHSFMKVLAKQFQSRGGQIAYNTELIGIEKNKDGFVLTVKESSGDTFSFQARLCVNCSGLSSDKVAGLAGLARDEYRLKFCKGDYFRVQQSKAKRINHLVYPVPRHQGAGLGVHATLDLAGSMRLGPDDEYVHAIDYAINPAKRRIFWESVRTFMPFIEEDDLSADTSGIRPKLQGPGEGFRDFIIQDEAANGLPGLINLIGIESPGLTASLSIARMVSKIAKPYV